MKASRRAAGPKPFLSGLLVLITACAGYDPNDSPGASDGDFMQDMSEVALGTESGNPSEPGHELGTESGNPGAPAPVLESEPSPAEDLGTESGNPTRPPPAPAISTETPATDGPVSVVDPPPEIPDQPEPVDTASPPPEVGGTAQEPDPVGAVDPNPEVPAPSTAPDESMTPGVQTPSSCDPNTCQAQAEAAAQEYGTVVPGPDPFESATCTDAGTCECTSVSSSVGLQGNSEEDVCLVEGRLGCLYSSAQFPGCDSAMTGSCDAACGEVQQAMASDALGVSVEVRASACNPYGCRYVLQSGEACYVSGEALTPELSDCAATDEELLGSR